MYWTLCRFCRELSREKDSFSEVTRKFTLLQLCCSKTDSFNNAASLLSTLSLKLLLQPVRRCILFTPTLARVVCSTINIFHLESSTAPSPHQSSPGTEWNNLAELTFYPHLCLSNSSHHQRKKPATSGGRKIFACVFFSPSLYPSTLWHEWKKKAVPISILLRHLPLGYEIALSVGTIFRLYTHQPFFNFPRSYKEKPYSRETVCHYFIQLL